MPPPLARVNPDLPPKFDDVIAKALEKDAKLRYQHAADIRTDLQRLKRDSSASGRVVRPADDEEGSEVVSGGGGSSRVTAASGSGTAAKPSSGKRVSATEVAAAAESGTSPMATKRPNGKLIATGVALVTLLGIGGYFYFHRAPKLTERDVVVVGDFLNTTGDTVFDGTLRQGLAVQLEQSPFLSLMDDDQVQQTLKMMQRAPDERLTSSLAREVCQRANATATIDGSIAQIGSEFNIIAKAVNCNSGETLASAQTSAADKSHVLDALSKVATDLRGKLGESLATVKKFDTPLEQASTSSLEALQAYSKARAATGAGNFTAAIPLLKRAIELDPNFAMAYAGLCTSYLDIGEQELSSQAISKAYELRDRVSDRERFYIESHYEQANTGNLIKGREIFQDWQKAYPRDQVPNTDLGVIATELGDYDAAFESATAAFRLNPSGLSYTNLIGTYIALNRLDEAAALAADAQAKKLDSGYLRIALYQIAFLRNDQKGMAEHVAWARGKAGVEDTLLMADSDTLAYFGRYKQAQALTQQAAELAVRADEKETAAIYWGQASARAGLFGEAADARSNGAKALGLANARDAIYLSALGAAFAGDAAKAESLADTLAKVSSTDTLLNSNNIPSVRAQIALIRHDPQKAIDELRGTEKYELGQVGTGLVNPALYPAYIRGNAYLALKQGKEAAAEFQKIIDHSGVVLNNPNAIMAYLGLARAYAVQGDDAKAHVAYQNLFAKWKDADPDLPVLVQAKAEYAKLK